MFFVLGTLRFYKYIVSGYDAGNPQISMNTEYIRFFGGILRDQKRLDAKEMDFLWAK